VVPIGDEPIEDVTLSDAGVASAVAQASAAPSPHWTAARAGVGAVASRAAAVAIPTAQPRRRVVTSGVIDQMACELEQDFAGP
jgi:hypothetical protein